MLDIVETYEKEFENKRVLGVHFRGKEQNISASHWFGPTKKQIFKHTDEIIEKFNIDKIFIVTEEKLYLEAFIKRYGDKVIYSDAMRISKTNIFNIKSQRKSQIFIRLRSVGRCSFAIKVPRYFIQVFQTLPAQQAL